jgi:hypothetical protein
MDKCPVDFAKMTPAEAKKAMEQLIVAAPPAASDERP